MNLERLHPKKALFCEGYACVSASIETIEDCPAQEELVRFVCSMKRPIIKNHDFQLDLDVNRYKHIFVFRRRDSYSSLISWFEACINFGWEQVIDTKQGFEQFVAGK